MGGWGVHGGCVGNRPGKWRVSGEVEMGGQWLDGKRRGRRAVVVWAMRKEKGSGKREGWGEGGGVKEASICVHMHSLERVEEYTVHHYVQLHVHA